LFLFSRSLFFSLSLRRSSGDLRYCVSNIDAFPIPSRNSVRIIYTIGPHLRSHHVSFVTVEHHGRRAGIEAAAGTHVACTSPDRPKNSTKILIIISTVRKLTSSPLIRPTVDFGYRCWTRALRRILLKSPYHTTRVRRSESAVDLARASRNLASFRNCCFLVRRTNTPTRFVGMKTDKDRVTGTCDMYCNVTYFHRARSRKKKIN
jgi:hypothetical protein